MNTWTDSSLYATVMKCFMHKDMFFFSYNHRSTHMNQVWLQDNTALQSKIRYPLIKIILLKYLCRLKHEAIELHQVVIWCALQGMYKLCICWTTNQLEFETKSWDLMGIKNRFINVQAAATFRSKMKVSYLALFTPLIFIDLTCLEKPR